MIEKICLKIDFTDSLWTKEEIKELIRWHTEGLVRYIEGIFSIDVRRAT